MNDAHTPTPWKWEAFDDRQFIQLVANIKDAEMSPVLVAGGCRNNGGVGCMPDKFDDEMRNCPLQPTRADRAFICHACNAHDAMVAVLKLARRDLRIWHAAYAVETPAVKFKCEGGCPTTLVLEQIDAVLKEGRP